MTDLDHLESLSNVAGTWFRGRGETKTNDGLTLVACRQPFRPYTMSTRARRASDAVVALAHKPTAEQVIDFVTRFGPLVDFRQWVKDLLPYGYAEAFEWVYGGFRLRDPTEEEKRRLVTDAIAAAPAGHLAPTRNDLEMFQDWCREQGHGESESYINQVIAGVLNDPHGTPLLDEPLPLYEWAGQMLTRLRSDLASGDLQPQTRRWLSDRLDDTRLRLSDQPGTLSMHATNLLSFLAAHTVADVLGYRPEMRACQECGKDFPVEDSRMRFCSIQCQERSKKRRQRRRSPNTGGKE